MAFLHEFSDFLFEEAGTSEDLAVSGHTHHQNPDSDRLKQKQKIPRKLIFSIDPALRT